MVDADSPKKNLRSGFAAGACAHAAARAAMIALLNRKEIEGILPPLPGVNEEGRI